VTLMQRITACRSCGAGDVRTVLELGEVPLANALLEDRAGEELRFPLTLAMCPSCSLVQILETVDPEVLFGHYLYFSSFSDTMLAHAEAAASMLIERCGLDAESLVVEIASNDGYLLRHFVANGIPVQGIEPAANIAEAANESGVPTLCDFFGIELAEGLAGDGHRADVIIGNNVLAHVADLNGFVAGVATLLAHDGCAVFEVPYVRDMIDRNEFDTIYHEHLCYFSLHALQALFARHGLAVTDVERLAIHGGSLRIFAERGGRTQPSVEALAAEERHAGLDRLDACRGFAQRVRQLRVDILAELDRRRAAGQTLAAYGASAKGSTLMNYAGIGPERLDFIVDRSTVKQGRYAPGNRLPILAPEALVERRPDAVLLLTWNFADEVIRQQARYLDAGGEFIIPVPRVRSIGKTTVQELARSSATERE